MLREFQVPSQQTISRLVMGVDAEDGLEVPQEGGNGCLCKRVRSKGHELASSKYGADSSRNSIAWCCVSSRACRAIEDYGLPSDGRRPVQENHLKAALQELEQLLAGALRPNEYVDEANLRYLKASLLTELGQRQRANYALWKTEALRAFFDSKDQALWLEVRWQRIKMLGEQRRWLAVRAGSLRADRLDSPLLAAQTTVATSALPFTPVGCATSCRGLTCGDRETAGTLLAAGLNDLEQVRGPEHVDKAIVPWDRSAAITIARECISQWRAKPW
jgi:hypothetical protein